MTAADKIEAARSIVAEFDESFFAHRKQFLRDALSEMADLADAQAQEIAKLRAALERAADDLRIIQTLNSHGADDRSYISALRNNAQAAEATARAALGETQ